MKDRPKITRIEVHQFEFQVRDTVQEPTISRFVYEPGTVSSLKHHAIKIFTDAGVTGEYVGGHAIGYSALPMLAHFLIGRNALEREAIYNQAKLVMKLYPFIALGPVDIALWDLAGKFYGAPICELLGSYRTSLPCYASTMPGDSHSGGLNSPEAFADFAQQLLERGFRGFKIHPWQSAPVERHVATVHAVGKRVGGKIDMMLDMFCSLNTFGEALKAGWACDEERFFWWEDPFRDGGVSAFAHRKLRQLVRTPLAQLEFKPGLESHVDFIVADATDFVRADANWDGGITGVMKIAHATEGFGLDMELHAPSPAHRHIMAAIRNCNYYEMGMFHPKAPLRLPPIYKDGYNEGMDAIDKDGYVQVPQGPGLGVEYDWDYITKHSTGVTVYD